MNREGNFHNMAISGVYMENPVYRDRRLVDRGVRTFSGTLAMEASSGRFVGEMTDLWGYAGFVGEVRGDNMCYTKIYIANEKEPIHLHPITYDYAQAGDRWEGKYMWGFGGINTNIATCTFGLPTPSDISSEDFAQRCNVISKEIGRRRYEIHKRYERLDE